MLLIVLGAAVVVGVVLVAVEARRGAHPLDVERQERWLVRHAPARIAPTLRYLDRRVAGGAMVAVSFVLLFGSAALLGWLLDSIDRGSGFARVDEFAAQWGADHATEGSTRVLESITTFGATPALALLMLCIGLIQLSRRGWGPLGYLAIVIGGVVAFNNLLKLLIERERPDIGRLVGASGSSFPSGHSAAAAACWAAIALVLLDRAAWRARAVGLGVAVAIAVAVATSRVLLGVHWFTDVLAGLAVGWTWFLLVTLVFGGRLLRFGEPAVRVARERRRWPWVWPARTSGSS